MTLDNGLITFCFRRIHIKLYISCIFERIILTEKKGQQLIFEFESRLDFCLILSFGGKLMILQSIHTYMYYLEPPLTEVSAGKNSTIWFFDANFVKDEYQ